MLQGCQENRKEADMQPRKPLQVFDLSYSRVETSKFL